MVAVGAACQHHPVRNQPWIAAFLGDRVPEYVIVLGRKSYIIVSSLETAIYLAFSIYYCLNLEYPMESKWMFSRFHLRRTWQRPQICNQTLNVI